MQKCRAKLLRAIGLEACAQAARYSHNSHHKAGTIEEEIRFVDKIANKLGHDAILKHAVFQYELVMPRAVLIELHTHKHQANIVQSTRFTLRELFEAPLGKLHEFLYDSGNGKVNATEVMILHTIRRELSELYRKGKINNDLAKLCLPESFMTKGFWTLNARALKDILSLRLAPSAHYAMRELMAEIVKVTPHIEIIMKNTPVYEIVKEVLNGKSI